MSLGGIKSGATILFRDYLKCLVDDIIFVKLHDAITLIGHYPLQTIDRAFCIPIIIGMSRPRSTVSCKFFFLSLP